MFFYSGRLYKAEYACLVGPAASLRLINSVSECQCGALFVQSRRADIMNFSPLDCFTLGCLYNYNCQLPHVSCHWPLPFPSMPFNHFRCPIRIFVEGSW